MHINKYQLTGHRQLKSGILRTNHINPERDLLQQLNFEITLRLIIDGAFDHSYPEVARVFQDLRTNCPGLFDTVLPRSERFQPPSAQLGDNDADEDGLHTIESDDAHGKPVVYSRLQSRHYSVILGLPVKPAELVGTMLRTLLTTAYQLDYNRPNVTTFGQRQIKYWKKLAYDDL